LLDRGNMGRGRKALRQIREQIPHRDRGVPCHRFGRIVKPAGCDVGAVMQSTLSVVSTIRLYRPVYILSATGIQPLTYMRKLWADTSNAFRRRCAAAVAGDRDPKRIDGMALMMMRWKLREARTHELVDNLLHDPREISRFTRSIRTGMVRNAPRGWIRPATQRILSRLFLSILQSCLH
jgi:hypothetical protein